MKNKLIKRNVFRKLAVFMAFNMLIESISPFVAFALTGGPSQPETESFEPVGTTQMVDLFSGDFNYNIPLLDVGGYPVNIAYHSGVGMEQEASWVGLGWNINPGAITRGLRGFPDDFNGENIKTEFNIMPNETWGVSVSLGLSIFGFKKNKAKNDLAAKGEKDPSSFSKEDSASLNDLTSSLDGLDRIKLSLGVTHNNYRGIGYSFNISADILQKISTGSGGNIGLGFNSQSGSDIGLSATISQKRENENLPKKSGGFSLGYNSITGLKDIGLNASARNLVKGNNTSSGSRTIPIGMNTYYPSSAMDMKTFAFSLDLTFGGELTGLHGNLSTGGYYSKEEQEQSIKYSRAYGYMYNTNSTYQNTVKKDALLDFNRTGDQTFNDVVTQLPMAFPTYDVFSVSGQGTGGMYRIYNNNVPVYYDASVKNKTNNLGNMAINAEFGVGNAAHTAGGFSFKQVTGEAGAWQTNNGFIATIDDVTGDPLFERYYLKMAGELTPDAQTEYLNWGGTDPKAIKLSKVDSKKNKRQFAKVDDGQINDLQYRSTKRLPRASMINFLSADDASRRGIGISPAIKSYPKGYFEDLQKGYTPAINSKLRTGDYRKGHHVSEVTQYSPDGTRYVFGIPAYNITQEETVFNTVNNDDGQVQNSNEYPELGLVNYISGSDNTMGNKRGINHFYSKKTIPGYAHSYLLTAVLSPDYVDVLNDGITDDDLGTAVTLNYTQHSSDYNWRAPYNENFASLDMGRYSDPMDSKGSYVYGKKEVWFLHSIISKTHLAIFKTSLRDDAYGVKGEDGGRSSEVKNSQSKLDSIVLYSKLDFFKSPKPTPIKTVIFDYDYSLCTGVPNNKNIDNGGLPANKKGKLTLKKIYFTYGHSNKGSLSPYKFDYQSTENDLNNPSYDLTKMDRWGNFKEHDEHMPNRDFPYATQNENAEDYASVWCLKEIKLPSGGKINVEYESDDYAYVQNRKAMEMVKITSAGNSINVDPNNVNNKLYDERKNNNVLFFKIDKNKVATNDDLWKYYLTGNENNLEDKIDQIYYRFRVNMAPNSLKKDYYEYISGYTTIVSAGISPKDDNYGYIEMREVSQGDGKTSKANSISKAAWQIGLQELRPIIFPGSSPKNYEKSAFMGLINSMPTILNVFTGPYQNLRWKKIAQEFSPNQSYIRLYSPTGHKKGGGVRVKKILLDDDWQNMSSGQNSTEYGQKFEYTTDNGKSSGVASYEPSIGNDENPFHYPEFRNQKIPMGPNLNLYSDIPIGEALFPGASVGYAEVRVTSIANAKSLKSSTGYTINKFYTAKDFPVIPDKTEIDKFNNQDTKDKILQSLFGFKKRNFQAATQGYVIELNDMHGKPKGVEVYGEDEGKKISRIGGSDYKYKHTGQRLVNKVPVLDSAGIVREMEIGREYEVSLDAKQSYDRIMTEGAKIGGDFIIPFIPIPVPWVWPSFQHNETMFQSMVATKVIQRYGILEEVVAYDYGSVVTTKNQLWDKETGQVLLTSTQNEYNDNIYNFTYPAHMAYEGMGMAYKNINYTENLWLNAQGYGNLTSNHFVPGDELLMLYSGNKHLKGWVLESTGSQVRIINDKGNPVTGLYTIRVIRSGRRNMFSNAIGSIVGMKNPMQGVGQPLTLNKEIIQTSAITYSDEWQGYWNRNFGSELDCDTFDLHRDYVKIWIKYFELYSSGGIYNKKLLSPSNAILSAMNIKDDCDWFESSEMQRYLNRICDDNQIFKDSAKFCFGFSEENRGFTKLQIVYNNQNSFLDIGCSMDWDMRVLPYSSDSIFEMPSSYLDSFYRIDSFTHFTTNFESTNEGYYDLTGYTTQSDSLFFQLSFSCATSTVIVCKDRPTCEYALGQTFNPYTNGLRGVWRPKETYAFNGERKYVHQQDSTRIRKDGIIKDYSPFWAFDGLGTSKLTNENADMSKWVAASTATLYSPEGNGLEEKNALGIYSSQIYGYDNTLVTAVGSNARHRQLAFDNFEDYNYVVSGCPRQNHFDFREGLGFTPIPLPSETYVWSPYYQFEQSNPKAYIRKDTAHSGYYSIAVNPNKSHSVTRLIDLSSIAIDNSGDTSLFRLTNAEQCVGLFAPDTGKKYVISAWVHQDGNVNDFNSYENAKVKVEIFDGGSTVVNQTYQASGLIIDGWQRLEGTFYVPGGADSIKVSLVNIDETRIAGFDDIRIHPFNGNMKSYVYHGILLRVIAELDENNFATFYEYDEEGTLIRVKKETERGIVTIQENRKSIKKQP